MQENGIVQSPIGQLKVDHQNFPFKLSWTHYQVLMTIEDPAERSFYEIEAIKGVWSVKTLKRQYNSSLYERLALSRDKNEVMVMAKILIVDDSRTSRKILKNIFENNGYEVVGEAVDGKDGVEKFIKLDPDIVTLDITMPVLDGVSALKEIMNINKNSKVIMVTAAGQQNNVLEAIKYGASEFVTKPFEEDVILDVVSRLTED